MRIQDKVLKAITKAAEKAGFEVVTREQYANTGSVFLMKGLDTLLSFGYDFQGSYASLQFYPKGKKIVRTCGFTHEDCVLSTYLEYHNMADKMTEIFGLIDMVAEKEAA